MLLSDIALMAGTIDLSRGWPSASLLPVSLLRSAASSALSSPSLAVSGLCYGPDEGHEPLRSALATWLTSFYASASTADPARICITGGASQSLGSVLSVCTDPEFTHGAWCVAPSYMLAFRIFDDAGLGRKLRAVPETEHGIDLDYLRAEMCRVEGEAERSDAPRYKPLRPWSKVYRHVVYCVPSFSNPSSRTMSLACRTELVRLAREFDALVVCDDVYDFLRWSAKPDGEVPPPVPRVVDVDSDLEGGACRPGADGFGNALSNGSFSKIAGPGLRCGWVEAAVRLSYAVSQAGIQRSGGAPSQLTSTYLAPLLSTGQLQTHIRHVLLPAYAARWRAMLSSMEQYLTPLDCKITRSKEAGGFFVWFELPDGIYAEELAKQCAEAEDVIIAPGKAFEVPGDNAGGKCSFARHVRLCFAWEDEEKLREGVRRVGFACKALMEGKCER